MDIGKAIDILKNSTNNRVARENWNGKGMFLQLQEPDAHSKMSLAYIYIKTVDGYLVPWVCSQADLLADDWIFVPEVITGRRG